MAIKAWWADLPDERLTETAWERQMTVQGIEAFHQSHYTKTGAMRAASEMTAGQKAIRDFVNKASLGIAEMQKEMLGVKRVPLARRGTVLLVPPDTSALITIRAMVDKAMAVEDHEAGTPLQTVCTTVAKAIELELNFRNWIEKSKEAAKAYAKAHGYEKPPLSLAEKLIKEEGCSRMELSRWRKAFADLNEYSWDTLEQHYCGEALVRAVTKACPEVFEIFTHNRGVKQETRLRLTPEFIERFNHMENKIAMMQAVKKPMITRPRPWKKESE